MNFDTLLESSYVVSMFGGKYLYITGITVKSLKLISLLNGNAEKLDDKTTGTSGAVAVL